MKSKQLYNIARYILAALFIFSGFTKGVNPFGLSIQFNEYFSALSLPFLAPLSPLCAIALPSGEMFLGFLLLFGLFRRVTRYIVVLAMGFFTLLTLWIAIKNPVNDCGCFGDVLKISNWATLYKNVIFSIISLLFFFYRPLQPSIDRPRRSGKLTLTILLLLVSFVLPIYCYHNLPLIDSTPYAIGSNVASQMRGTLREVSDTKVVCRDLKTGNQRTFSLQDTVWQDDTKWEYVDTQTLTTTTGTAPRISTLAMIDSTGVDRAPEILEANGATFLIIIPDPTQLYGHQSVHIRSLTYKAKLKKARVVVLTAVDCGAENVAVLKNLTSLIVDRSVLQAMVQNKYGGAIMLENGIIIDKWAL
ncbi:MAG: DoxX family membrane protein [Mucinivorans sp.]